MKNDTTNAEAGTRSTMNRPFWIASGVKSGANLALTISSGRVRMPYSTRVLWSGQQQSLTFSAEASKYYTVFLRQDRTFIVSGTGASSAIPDPPRWDAQYLGQVGTGAFASSADISGPWNQTATLNNFEQRGEAPTFGYPTTYRQGLISGSDGLTGGPSSSAAPSGLLFLTFPDRTTSQIGRGTLLQGSVTYQISGALQAGVLYATPVFTFEDNTGGIIFPVNGTVNFYSSNTSIFTQQNQNPDSATLGANTVQSVALHNLSTGGDADGGYRLSYYWDTARSSTGANAVDIRFVSAVFTATPGWRVPISPDRDES